jgi:hypothetical protein
MKIKILKDEYLFNEQGTHVCDSNGVAIKALNDIECDVNEKLEIVLELIRQDRENRGLDMNGDPFPVLEPELVSEAPAEAPTQQDDSLVVETIVTGEENGI